MRSPLLKVGFSCLAGGISGFIIITLPAIIAGRAWSLFALAEFAVKNLSREHLLLLLIVGFVWGLLLPWPYSLLAAIFKVASLPAIAIVEMFGDSTSHNLWPLEFLVYAGLTLVPVLGMTVGLSLRKRLQRRPGQISASP
jgi:hypothetical protein